MNTEDKKRFDSAFCNLSRAQDLLSAFIRGKEVSEQKVKEEEKAFVESLMPFIREAVQRHNETIGVRFLIIDFDIELKKISILNIPINGILIVVKKLVDKEGKEPTVQEFTKLVYEDGLHKAINEMFRPILVGIFEKWGISVPLVEVSTLKYFDCKLFDDV